jgi:hypothetical protein
MIVALQVGDEYVWGGDRFVNSAVGFITSRSRCRYPGIVQDSRPHDDSTVVSNACARVEVAARKDRPRESTR